MILRIIYIQLKRSEGFFLSILRTVESILEVTCIVLENPAANPFFKPITTCANGRHNLSATPRLSRPSPRLLHSLPTRPRDPPRRPHLHHPRLPRRPPDPDPLHSRSQKARNLQTDSLDTAPAPLARPRAHHTVGERQQHQHAAARGERGALSGREGPDAAGRCGHVGCGEGGRRGGGCLR